MVKALQLLAALEFQPGLPDPVTPPDYTAILRSPLFWCFIGLAFLAVFFFRMWMLSRPAPDGPPPFNRSAALAALRELESKNLPPRDTAAEVWHVTRRYLAQTHKIETLQKTTYEIFQQIRRDPNPIHSPNPFNPRLLARFEPLGVACDEMEFGKQSLPERRGALIAAAVDIINQDTRHVDQLPD